MRATALVLLCLTAALLSVVVALPSEVAQATASECLDLGFEKDVVRCNMCAKLFLMTQHEELRWQCESCCTVSEGDRTDDVIYVSARIEVRGMARMIAPWQVNSIAMFKRTYSSEPYFKHISFVERSSQMFPRVVLVSSDPKDVMTMHISGWSAETLHNLFRKKIRVH
ncbi:hypothetical protein LSCM1_03432 [Leishmania martiniquensis]|uniref:Selenoprotein F/M domain-containing protein n=1 Tax=Leishmania martiniquensis TaxID=1580590 RepID=A0A836GKA2_9TRYP|nr:hypothetical protein LSCM1_03432 [Leishmania martiniquensis]